MPEYIAAGGRCGGGIGGRGESEQHSSSADTAGRGAAVVE